MMSDFELGSRNAIKEVYIGIKVRGCAFHFHQALWKKLQALGLVRAYKRNKAFRKTVKLLMGLCFLPPEYLLEVYNIVKDERVGLRDYELPLYLRFLAYLKRYWLSLVPAEELSTFKVESKTNNALEAHHKQMKAKIKTHQPVLWR
jgi:hypothetical protein